ncbi:MAG: hypothetical protein L0Z73_20005 [Gammaproteobacteria bacterium]|nr:hypothetical protein [Gammaproteobacteria bacterium]
MSSPKYASPLRFNIVPSRIMLFAISALHLGAAALLVLLALPVAAKLFSAVTVLLSLAMSLFRLGWLTGRSLIGKVWPGLVEAIWDEHDQWQLTDSDQQTHYAELLPATYVHPHLSIINLRLHDRAWYNRHRAIVLLRDNIDPDTFRRLRIRLRWYTSQAPGKLAGSK